MRFQLRCILRSMASSTRGGALLPYRNVQPVVSAHEHTRRGPISSDVVCLSFVDFNLYVRDQNSLVVGNVAVGRVLAHGVVAVVGAVEILVGIDMQTVSAGEQLLAPAAQKMPRDRARPSDARLKT